MILKKLLVIFCMVGVLFSISCDPTEEDRILIINDKRCETCDTSQLVLKLKSMFSGTEIVELDYSDSKAKELFNTESLKTIPAVLFTKKVVDKKAFVQIMRYSEKRKNFRILNIGAKFDPKAEICNNKIDDNNDNAIDCADPTCKSNFLCMEKRDKPTVSAFVMSHCPYGTQIEKGLLPVWKELKGKADINIRFCNYAMHDKKEIDEQLRQECIQTMFPNKFLSYLECFLTAGKDQKCIKAMKINKGKLKKCVAKLDKKFKVTDGYNDKSKWVGRFPPFNIHDELNKKYKVRGSPTLIVNDVVVQAGRSSAALLKAICLGFKKPPAACNKKLSEKNPSAGFGFKEGDGGGAAAKCGN